MSRRNFKRENDSLINRGNERRLKRNESKPKPFMGFTSPYRRLNEQALFQKNQTDVTRERRRFSNGLTNSYPNETRNSRGNFIPTTPHKKESKNSSMPNKHKYKSEQFNRSFDSRPSYNYEESRTYKDNINHRNDNEKDKFHSYSNINPWNDKYMKETENTIRQNKKMKKLNEDSVYGKVNWEYNISKDQVDNGKDFEKPMDPKEFREQCHKAYLRAAEERQRNAELSVWGKCNWATYDKFKDNQIYK
ncbi:hypothetical protein PGB90_009457 [Kerria lacca]